MGLVSYGISETKGRGVGPEFVQRLRKSITGAAVITHYYLVITP
jgi:hypothetical protein